MRKDIGKGLCCGAISAMVPRYGYQKASMRNVLTHELLLMLIYLLEAFCIVD